MSRLVRASSGTTGTPRPRSRTTRSKESSQVSRRTAPSEASGDSPRRGERPRAEEDPQRLGAGAPSSAAAAGSDSGCVEVAPRDGDQRLPPLRLAQRLGQGGGEPVGVLLQERVDAAWPG